MAMRPVVAGETVGPSWRSVQELVVSIENHHKVTIKADARFAGGRGDGIYTYWTVSSWRTAPPESLLHVRSVVRGWPHPDHKTVPGMLFGMLYELDEKLARMVWHQLELAL